MNLRQNRYEQHVLPLNYKPVTCLSKIKIKIFHLMKTTSITQIIILIILTILIFSDFSKIKKRVINLFKNLRIKSRKKGS